MKSATIVKQPASGTVMTDYESTAAQFSWAGARSELSSSPAMNIAAVALDRHLEAGRGDVVALRCIDRAGAVTDLSYRDLHERVCRFASVLDELGVERGARVFSLLGRIPELHVTALGALRHGAVFAPLFAAFGPGPILERMRLGEAQVLVTTAELYRKRIAEIRAQVPTLRHVLVVDPGPEPAADVLDLRAAMAGASPEHPVADTTDEDVSLLHFTSGTTGKPKAAVHVHGAAVAHNVTARFALDLRPGDIYWCTADPGWVTGVSYGVIAPLTVGVTSVLDAREFDAKDWYGVLADQRVNVWYTAPTALRMLMRHGAGPAQARDLTALRHIASVGEPLNPEVVIWAQETLGLPVHDTWWQTETGAIMISNYACMDIRPGSMGRSMPGVEAAVLVRDDSGRALTVDGAVIPAPVGAVGELALRRGWPSMFRAYLHDESAYRAAFAGEWYRTGDLAQLDEDGYFWFVGRADDVIKSAGHLIGPFEVESTLMEHPAVAEVGVIGKPDEVAGEIVKAFVSLRPGFSPDETTRMDLLAYGRRCLGGVAPREIEFDQQLPHTSSGKVMRRLLKARELGLPEGDLSTLEPAR